MTEPLPSEAIRTDGLTKRFAARRALRGVDLTLEAGSSLAVFGPNGAGKTTLIRVLTLGLKPTDGRFTVAGCDPGREAMALRQAIGVISHRSYLYEDLTAAQNLEFFARLYGVSDPRECAARLLDELELSRRADDAVHTLSRGLRQRVSLARALVHEPKLVFLDEPFTGLDPHAADLLRKTLERLRERGRTVFLVTHNLVEGLGLCDRFIVLSRGRVVDQGASADVDRIGFERRYFEAVSRPVGSPS
ncbi:ABC transporter ATP-binding protein [bacterium]|nr:ABC transporter ATP-binding protein [bacterium]